MRVLEALRDSVNALEVQLRAASETNEPLLGSIVPNYRVSALNFIHYVTLRQTDLRQLQLGLLSQGLSSLGRLEGHVLDAITKVRERLDDSIACRGGVQTALPEGAAGPPWKVAERLLHAHTHALLGPQPPHRHVYVMVTAPSASEADGSWMARLLDAGMNVLRVNAAHEDVGAWTQIVATARAVAEARDVPLRIVVDLPGPKLRTVMLQEGTRVEKWRPERDELGRVVSPCTITLQPRSLVGAAKLQSIRVPDELWKRLEVGDKLAFRDARDKARALSITRRSDTDAVAELEATAYVVPDTRMVLRRGHKEIGELQVEAIALEPFRLPLTSGERFCLVRLGASAPLGLKAVGCTLDQALASLEIGQRVLFDDGHLEAVVEELAPTHALLKVTYAQGGVFKLGGEKGINLPDTELDLPLFSADDEQALAFAAERADLVGASFVRGPDDVRELYRRLAALNADGVGVVLKIETNTAFAALPAIVLAALERAPVGVMIARGDLAMESGYERLAELQEEILWLCEAAHMPVIWATQVLDTLARTGRPSRAEVTDAAMAVRAECVMLNKGPYVAQAVSALDDILRRMEQHQYKKRSLYRRLHLELPKPAAR